VGLANLGSESETCVGSRVRLVLESPSPSRRIFIGSHSLPPSLVRRIGPSDPPAWCGAARTLCAGDVETPFLVEKLLSGGGIKVTKLA
jgi:hypothetical protein